MDKALKKLQEIINENKTGCLHVDKSDLNKENRGDGKLIELTHFRTSI